MKHVFLTLGRSTRPRQGGLAAILAQAPAVSSAFGRWPGFVLILLTLIGVFALNVVTAVLASKVAGLLLG
jgi:hypothetical protein